MAFSAPFTAPQMNWETGDSILAFGKFRQKCELMFKSVLKDVEGEEQVSYILLWIGEDIRRRQRAGRPSEDSRSIYGTFSK